MPNIFKQMGNGINQVVQYINHVVEKAAEENPYTFMFTGETSPDAFTQFYLTQKMKEVQDSVRGEEEPTTSSTSSHKKGLGLTGLALMCTLGAGCDNADMQLYNAEVDNWSNLNRDWGYLVDSDGNYEENLTSRYDLESQFGVCWPDSLQSKGLEWRTVQPPEEIRVDPRYTGN